MQKQFEDTVVRNAIKTGLESFVLLAKDNLRKRWTVLKREDKYAAARALVFMNELARNPELHFARENTQKAWVERAEKYALDKKLEKTEEAYYIVESPQIMVVAKAQGALTGNLYAAFFAFCTDIQQWEYDRTSPNKNNRYLAPVSAEILVEKSEKLHASAKMTIKHPVVKYLQKKWRMLTK